MSTIGLMGLLVAFAGVAVSVLCLLTGAILGRKGESSLGETLTWGGHIASILTTVALTVCCGILVYCFFAGDYSIEYVLKQHSNARLAVQAVRPVGRPRGFAAVLGVAYQRVQLRGGHP